MIEPESARGPEPDEEAVRDDLARQLGVDRDRFEIVRLAPAEWPEAIKIYYALRKDRHGRVFYHYVCFEGELYSPFAPDGLERLLKRLFSSRRFTLNAEQIANLLLMYHRPEPMMTLITSAQRDLIPSDRELLERLIGLKEIAPELTTLDEDLKLTFWTLNVRREIIKRWTAYISEQGRSRIIEDGEIDLRDARQGENS